MDNDRPTVTVTLPDGQSVDVAGVTMDSRRVRPGDLWVALPGARVHGARFARQALEQGAVAVLTDEEGAARVRAIAQEPVLVAVSPDPRRDMAPLAAAAHGFPSRAMPMFGVTGTNGKTTTVHLLAAMLRAAGLRVGTIGTLGFELDGEHLRLPTSTVTTPESPDLQALLEQFVDGGADVVAMEVSSHALALNRADGIEFNGVGFTNLNRDHLDFHETMEAYFEAKARLFSGEFGQHAVVHLDDPWAGRMQERVHASGLELRTVGRGPEADYRILDAGPQEFALAHPAGELRVPMRLPGDFNRINAALAMALVDGQDIGGVRVTPDLVAPGLAAAHVPGRMQPVPLGADGPDAYVDFAHTPDSVAAVLEAFDAERAAGRTVVAVVGCGGDRDRTKRAPMGAAAALGASVAIITDDNPRSEDPASIRAAALVGAREINPDSIDGGDRRSAIVEALHMAGPDGIVVVLGKGHEQGQDINGEIIPFDDAEVLIRAWADLTADHTGSR